MEKHLLFCFFQMDLETLALNARVQGQIHFFPGKVYSIHKILGTIASKCKLNAITMLHIAMF